MTPEELARAQTLLKGGATPREVAKALGFHHTTLLRKLGAAGYRIEQESSFRLTPLERVLLPGSEARQ